jgi:NADH:ubiquinone oxidoreductase subunit 5 (subunit L)/multisubunit Na+/H+ antiporter MnhA subunit
MFIDIVFFFSSNFYFNISFLVDFFSFSFLRFVCLISSIVMYYRKFYMMGDLRVKRFVILVLFFVLSMGILIVGSSIFTLILG